MKLRTALSRQKLSAIFQNPVFDHVLINQKYYTIIIRYLYPSYLSKCSNAIVRVQIILVISIYLIFVSIYLMLIGNAVPSYNVDLLD